jgi:hypothetical protein
MPLTQCFSVGVLYGAPTGPARPATGPLSPGTVRGFVHATRTGDQRLP